MPKALTKSKTKSNSKVSNLSWPTMSDDIPQGANVILGFHGLMCFCYRHNHSDKNCEIGIHNNSLDHNLKITVYSVSPNFNPPYQMDMQPCSVIPPSFGKGQTGSLKGNTVYFKAHRPAISGVSFFQRGDLREHPNNFTHILDLERDIYDGKVLPKKVDKMGPRLRVNCGLFYTLCKSATTFERVDTASPPDSHRPIGSVARMVGANIYLKSDGYVTLEMPGVSDIPPLKASEGKFFVLIDNACAGSTYNDFHLYYDTFEPPSLEPRYNVTKVIEGIPKIPKGSPCALIEKKIVSTDDAPCGAAGFGGSGGLNEPPA